MKTNIKMVALNPTMSIIILKVNSPKWIKTTKKTNKPKSKKQRSNYRTFTRNSL